MKKIRLALLPIGLFALAAFDSSTIQSLKTVAGATDSGTSANGHYEIFVGGGRQTISFNSRVQDDGTADGMLQLKSRGQDGKLHADIYCLYVEGNTAYMKGVVTNGGINGDNSLEGFHFRIIVQDNGEGENSPPDLATDIDSVRPGPDPVCGKNKPTPPLTFYPVEEGNIQVKP